MCFAANRQWNTSGAETGERARKSGVQQRVESCRGRHLLLVLRELADKFVAFVDVLSEVSERTGSRPIRICCDCTKNGSGPAALGVGNCWSMVVSSQTSRSRTAASSSHPCARSHRRRSRAGTLGALFGTHLASPKADNDSGRSPEPFGHLTRLTECLFLNNRSISIVTVAKLFTYNVSGGCSSDRPENVARFGVRFPQRDVDS